MKKIRAIALLVGAMVLAATPVSADHSYFASATSTGLRIGSPEEGQNLTIGFTEAKVQTAAVEGGCAEGIVACARAAGLLEPFGSSAEAESPGNEGPNQAVGGEIPEPLNQILAGSFGVGTAAAAGPPTVTATGDAASGRLDVTLTQSIAENLPVQDALEQVSDELLGPIAEGDPTGTAQTLKDAVDLLIENLDDVPIATIELGPSSSESIDENGVTTAQAEASGARIVVGPTPQLGEEFPGLIVIDVGGSSAVAQSDQLTATAAFDPAIARLRVLNPSGEEGPEYSEVAIQPGESGCGGEGTPLATCIAAGSGETQVEGASATAQADGVTITLLDGMLEARLAFAAVAVAASPPAAPPPPPAAPPLPATGWGMAIPALGLAVIGGLGIVALRRRQMS